MPMASDSASTWTPRTSGHRTQGCASGSQGRAWVSEAISPSGLRTATAHDRGPRIMTPSTSAWPPIDGRTLRGSPAPAAASPCEGSAVTCGSDAGGPAPVLLLEALDAPARVDELLLARVEGVALRADLDLQFGFGRLGLERVSAGAADGRQHVVGMDARLQGMPLLSCFCMGLVQ